VVVTSPTKNIQLRCRAHNVYEAQLFSDEGTLECVKEARPAWWTGDAAQEPWRLALFRRRADGKSESF
jgi:hypothetical protein